MKHLLVPFEFLSPLLRWLQKGRILIVMVGLAITGLALLIFVSQPRLLQYLDHKIFDQLLMQKGRVAPSPIPVIVDIDDDSLARYGQWPWPRSRIARLAEKIHRQGPLTVVLDIVFAEPDRTSPAEIQRVLREETGIFVNFQGLPEALMDNDRILADVLSQGSYVLGYKFFATGAGNDQECLLHPVKAILSRSAGPEAERGLFSAPNVVCPLPFLARAAETSGFTNTVTDIDGVLRRTPLLMEYRGRYYPCLALAALFKTLGVDQLVMKTGARGVEHLRWGRTVVPTDAQGNLLLDYRGPERTFPYFSATEVLEDRVAPDAFKGKIVLVGSSASGLQDNQATALDPIFPGVEVHATVLDNLLQQDFLYRPGWGPGLEMITIIVVGCLSSLLLSWSRAGISLLVLGVTAVGMWFGALWSLQGDGIFVSPLMPLLTLAVNFGSLTLLKFRREESEKRFFHNAFSHYVSPVVVEQMVKNPDRLSLTGENREVTILFADIRGFTSLSEKLSPERVARLLRVYFTPMTAMIIKNRGTLDKFIGDAVMAFWNAPVETPAHQELALQAALDMLAELDRLNPELQKDFGLQLTIGIGLHCGRVSVGNMGTEDLFNYTIVGDSVNLASRLEGLSKVYGLPLILSETVRQVSAGAFVFLEVDKVRVLGKDRPVTIYTAYSQDKAAGLQGEIRQHEAALRLYRARLFREAYESFAALAMRGRHLKLHRLYEERCRHLRDNPPGEDWDSVVDLSVK